MILAAVLLCGLGLGQETPLAPPPASAHRAPPWAQDRHFRQAWERLSPEERRRIEERRRQFLRLSPEAQDEIRRRFRTLDGFRAGIARRLPPEERRRLEALPPEQRRRLLDERVRRRLEEMARRQEQEYPGEALGLRGLPLDQRLRRARELFLRHRQGELREHLRRATENGWLGPRAAELLRQAPPEEAMQVLAHFGKWEQRRRLDEEGGWQRLGVDAAGREQLLRLPPVDFMRALRMLRAGETLEHSLRAARSGNPLQRGAGRPRGGGPGD